jgi:hypothetical protein
MIWDFLQDVIFVLVFTSSRSSDHDEQIFTLTSAASKGSASRVKRFLFDKETNRRPFNALLLYLMVEDVVLFDSNKSLLSWRT